MEYPSRVPRRNYTSPDSPCWARFIKIPSLSDLGTVKHIVPRTGTGPYPCMETRFPLPPHSIVRAREEGERREEKEILIQRSQTEEMEAPPLKVNDTLVGYLHVDSV